MRLIIWWLALIFILPLLYLWWWKKSWRLILGVTIVAILIISFFIPREVVSSVIRSQIGKEVKNKVKKIGEFIKEVSQQESNSENQAKVEGAKLIVEAEEKLEQLWEEVIKILRESGEQSLAYKGKQTEYYLKLIATNRVRNKWVIDWSKEIFSSAVLFCGEEFNQKLTTKGFKIEGQLIEVAKNSINFNDYQDKSAEEIKEKLLEIIKKEDLEKREFSVVFLKDIDKIVKQEVKELILTLLGQESNASLWKYEFGLFHQDDVTPNLSKFVFVASSSNSGPNDLSGELRKNFRIVEVPLSKNWLIIFILSGGIEIIVFFFLIRNQRKNQQKELQKFD